MVLVIDKDRFLKFFKQYNIMVVATPIQEQQNTAAGITSRELAIAWIDPSGKLRIHRKPVNIGQGYYKGYYIGRLPDDLYYSLERLGDVRSDGVYIYGESHSGLENIINSLVYTGYDSNYVSRNHLYIKVVPTLYGEVSLEIYDRGSYNIGSTHGTGLEGEYIIKDPEGFKENLRGLEAEPHTILREFVTFKGAPVTRIKENEAAVVTLAPSTPGSIKFLIALVAPYK